LDLKSACGDAGTSLPGEEVGAVDVAIAIEIARAGDDGARDRELELIELDIGRGTRNSNVILSRDGEAERGG
jgi:hypothetical protein